MGQSLTDSDCPDGVGVELLAIFPGRATRTAQTQACYQLAGVITTLGNA